MCFHYKLSNERWWKLSKKSNSLQKVVYALGLGMGRDKAAIKTIKKVQEVHSGIISFSIEKYSSYTFPGFSMSWSLKHQGILETDKTILKKFQGNAWK